MIHGIGPTHVFVFISNLSLKYLAVFDMKDNLLTAPYLLWRFHEKMSVRWPHSEVVISASCWMNSHWSYSTGGSIFCHLVHRRPLSAPSSFNRRVSRPQLYYRFISIGSVYFSAFIMCPPETCVILSCEHAGRLYLSWQCSFCVEYLPSYKFVSG